MCCGGYLLRCGGEYIRYTTWMQHPQLEQQQQVVVLFKGSVKRILLSFPSFVSFIAAGVSRCRYHRTPARNVCTLCCSHSFRAHHFAESVARDRNGQEQRRKLPAIAGALSFVVVLVMIFSRYLILFLSLSLSVSRWIQQQPYAKVPCSFPPPSLSSVRLRLTVNGEQKALGRPRPRAPCSRS